MTTATTVKASNIADGETIISPVTNRPLLIRATLGTFLGMIDFKCINEDGERVTLTLAADEDVRVIDA